MSVGDGSSTSSSSSEGDEQQQQQHRCVWVSGPIIVGSGPSGLATAAWLDRLGVPCILLDRSDKIASLWHYRTYDRLKLHLPKNFCQLPFIPFPSNFPDYPSKHQFLDYISSYAQTLNIRPRLSQNVFSAKYDQASGLWRVLAYESSSSIMTNTSSTAGGGDDQDELGSTTRLRTPGVLREYISRWVVVATGENAEAAWPEDLMELGGLRKFNGEVVHTSDYKSGEEYRGKKVLVVGCGNSGMEVSLDLCNQGADPYMVVRNSVHVLPREVLGFSTFGMVMALLKWLPVRVVDKILLVFAYLVLGRTEKLGIPRPKVGPIELKNSVGKTPVLDVGALSAIKAGKIKVRKGVKEVTCTGAKFVDGLEEDFDAILLATGYKSNVPSWLKGTEHFTVDGMPTNPFPNGWKGKNGLYCVGFTRRGILGACSDAAKIAKDVAQQWKALAAEGTARFIVSIKPASSKKP